MSDLVIKELETKLDKLIEVCESLQRENQAMQASKAEWQKERTRLIEKNDIARTRVEAMIGRLKNLEKET